MGRKREPVAVIEAKGNRSKLTPAEKAKRRAEEIALPDADFIPPGNLSEKQAKEFREIADYLCAINRQNAARGGGNIYSGMDAESIGQYIICKDLAHHYQLKLQKAIKAQTGNDSDKVHSALLIQKAAASQHRYYCEQTRKYAADLGLTVSSRMKIVLPGRPDEDGEYGGF